MTNSTHPRNTGISLNLDWLNSVKMNRSALERRCETLTKRRSIKKEWQAAWLLKSLRCMDLTTLSSDDTPDRVRRLCAKARQPLRSELPTCPESGFFEISDFLRRLGNFPT